MSSPLKTINYRTLFWFLLVNFVLTIGLSYQYILYASFPADLWGIFFVHFALLANFVPIYLIISVLLYLIFFLIPSRGVLVTTAALSLSALHLVNLIDIGIFRIFNFHINRMVLNLVFTEGVGDSLQLGAATLVPLAAIILGIILFEFFLVLLLFRKLGHRRLTRRFLVWLTLIGLIITLADKVIFAVADFHNKTTVTRQSKTFPLYQPFTVKRFVRRHFNWESDQNYTLAIDRENSTLRYPKTALTATKLDEYPNVIWILIDAWRFDMLSEETTPRIWDFAQRAMVFTNHYSGGNASRFGVFSLFYGVYGFLWHQFLGERQSPVLLDELANLGYEFKIISSSRLTSPEFRKTAFVKIPECLVDQLDGDSAAERDPLLTTTFVDWLDSRDTSRPFFSFLFYDAPHGPFHYPAAFAKYSPAINDPNYLTINRGDTISLKNGYKNAIGFDDFQVGIVLEALAEKNLLDHSIIIISGDHGEEFYESGFLGHTSAFSREQTKVPLVLSYPGCSPQTVGRLTSHLDLVPTTLTMLGYAGPVGDYSQGQSLLTDPGHHYVVSAGWDDCAIITEDYSIVFSYETYNMVTFEVRDQAYQLLEDRQDVISRYRPEIVRVLRGFSEFGR